MLAPDAAVAVRGVHGLRAVRAESVRVGCCERPAHAHDRAIERLRDRVLARVPRRVADGPATHRCAVEALARQHRAAGCLHLAGRTAAVRVARRVLANSEFKAIAYLDLKTSLKCSKPPKGCAI